MERRFETQSALCIRRRTGQHDTANTSCFIRRVRSATAKRRFRVSSDGWATYDQGVETRLSDRASYGHIVNVTNPVPHRGHPQGPGHERN